MSNELATLSFNGYDIRPDENGDLSLTLLWKAAGANAYQKPADWKRKEGATYLSTVSKDLKMPVEHLLKSKQGRYGGTTAMPEIALEYAKYLHPKLARLVNQVFLERVEEEKNPDLIVDRAVKTYERRGFTPEHIAARLNGKATRLILTSTLKSHGINTADGYRQCTNATYYPLFGGGTTLIRQKYSIPAKANVRDNLPLLVIRGIEFAEALGADGIERKGLYGIDECVGELNRSAQIVGAMVKQHRGGASL
jgi:hypothetical protein